MADPRLDASIVGVGAEYATFLIDNSTITYSATTSGGSAQIGLAVGLSAANTVQLVSDAEEVVGKLIKVESDNVATVQVRGGMTLAGGTGASLTLGKKIVGDLLIAAKGYIREVNTAVVAEIGVARGMICDAGTTTAVEVYLD